MSFELLACNGIQAKLFGPTVHRVDESQHRLSDSYVHILVRPITEFATETENAIGKDMQQYIS